MRETGESAENGLEEVYVNALARDGSEVSALMRVLTEAEAYDGKLVRAGLVDARAGAASLGLDPDEVERMLA